MLYGDDCTGATSSADRSDSGGGGCNKVDKFPKNLSLLYANQNNNNIDEGDNNNNRKQPPKLVLRGFDSIPQDIRKFQNLMCLKNIIKKI